MEPRAPESTLLSSSYNVANKFDRNTLSDAQPQFQYSNSSTTYHTSTQDLFPNMSRHRTSEEGSAVEDLGDLLRELDIAQDRHLQSSIQGSMSALRVTGLHAVTPSRPEEDSDDQSTDGDEGLSQLVLRSSLGYRLTIFSGGVALSAHKNETLAECAPSSLADCTSLPSSSVDQVVRTMTPTEVEIWARNHNNIFLESLTTSMVAHNNAAAPQTPSPRSSRTAGRLHTPHSSSTASRGPSCLVFSGDRSHGSTLTPLTPSSDVVTAPQSALSPAAHPFRPNNMVLQRIGVLVTPTPQRNHGSNYLGRRHSSPSAREVQGLPDCENCALFLTKIPVEVTLHEIFSVITTGSVFCLHVSPSGGIHTTKAAKLVFMTPEAAAAFLQQTRSPQGILLRGKRIQCRYNRNGYARNENIWQSRVLEIVGPTPIMTLEYWTSYFANFSEFELEAYRLNTTNVHGIAILQFRFARIDGQAQTCLQCIRTDPSLAGVVQVRYGTDPCGSSAASSALTTFGRPNVEG